MRKRENGVTILVLVVTIIVMIILVGIAIGNFIGDNGLVSQTEEVLNEYELYKEGEEQKVEDLAMGIKKSNQAVQVILTESTVEWTNKDIIVRTEVRNMPENYFIYMKIGDTGEWQKIDELVISANEFSGSQKVTACVAEESDPNKVKPIRQSSITISNIDTQKPTSVQPEVQAATSKLTVNCKQSDEISGINTKMTQYAIRKNGDTTWGSWQSSNVFNGLDQNTKYDVKTKVTDNAGNEQESSVASVTTGAVPDTITFAQSTTNWTNGSKTITVSTTATGYTLQTKLNNGPWETSATKTTSQYGDVVYARLYDGTNYGATKTYTEAKIDTAKPNTTAPTLALTTGSTTKSITVTNKQADIGSGSNTTTSASGIKTVQYAIKKNGDTTWGSWQSSNVFNGLDQNTKYDVKTKVIDNAGNEQESSVASITTQRDTSSCTIDEISDQTYNGSALTPEPVVKYDGVVLTKNTDYTVEYTNNINVGTATIIITGKGEYLGSKTVTFKIIKVSVNVPTVKTNRTYNATSQSPEWNNYNTNLMTIGGTTSATNAGTYTATFTLKDTSNYQWNDGTTSSKSINWTINKYNLSNATVASVSAYTYDGNNKTPTPAVTVPIPSGNTTTLTNDTHFTYSYSNNNNAGTATVTVTAKSDTNYTGSKAGTFTINRANGSGSVTMDGWIEGNAASNPVPVSSTNGTSNVSYQYKVSSAADSTYTSTKPTTVGTYTVKATFAQTTNYESCTATASFTIQAALYEVSSVASGKLKYQRSLKNSVDAANADATIKALANTSESDSFTINKNITINPNGKTLTRTAGTVTISAGTTTINSSGTITQTGTTYLFTVSGGTLSKSGTSTLSANDTTLYLNNSSSKLDLNGGTITGKYAGIIQINRNCNNNHRNS